MGWSESGWAKISSNGLKCARVDRSELEWAGVSCDGLEWDTADLKGGTKVGNKHRYKWTR